LLWVEQDPGSQRGGWVREQVGFFLGSSLWESGGRELGGGGRLEEVREEKWLSGNEPERLV